MQIDRKMANCLLQIKMSLPEDVRNHFKLSSPKIAEMVYVIHQSTHNQSAKRLTRLFLESAGMQWNERVNPSRMDTLRIKQGDVIINKILSNIKRHTSVPAYH